MNTARHLTHAVAALVLAGLVLSAVPAEAQRRVEVYKSKHRTAQELQPLVQAVLGGAGSAVVDAGTNSIVIMGDAAAVEDALGLLAIQDKSLRTVVVRYESKKSAELQALGIRVDWSARAGPVRFGNVRFPGGRSGAVVTPTAVDRKTEGSFASTLRILEGQSGRISTGRTVPVTLQQGWRTTTHLATGESGLEATPRILGDGKVQLDIQPFEGSVDNRGVVSFTDASTRVVVTPGETVALGGLDRSGSGREVDAFGGAAKVNAASEQLLLLTVEVE